MISFMLNGLARTVECSPVLSVRRLLREYCHIVSVRGGDDDSGFTGNDLILRDDVPALASLLVAAQIEGTHIRTVESLAPAGELSEIQRALVDAGVVQDAYNAPAAALLLTELLERTARERGRMARPTREELRDALAGFFVRDCGYEPFFLAMDLFLKRRDGETLPRHEFRPDLRYVGSPSPKVDAGYLVQGQAAFVEDFVPQNALHLYIVRSPYAHAYIKTLDTSAAEKSTGVECVLTYKNTPDIYYTQAGQGFPEPSPHDRRLFGQKMRHVGDRVAGIVAESLECAREAARLIKVEYEILPPVLSIAAAAAENAPCVHESLLDYVVGAPENLAELNRTKDARDGRIQYQFPIGAAPHKNLAASTAGHIGDLEQGFAQADVTLFRTYASSQVQCAPPETHVCYALVERDRLVVHASTQVPWHVRRVVARLCGLPQNRVQVKKERVGGAYGSKQDILVEDVCAYAAWHSRKPVFYQNSREEEFIACSTRHVVETDVRLGARKDGTITAIQMDVRGNTGPYGNHCLTVPMNGCSKSLPLYLCPNMGFSVNVYYSNIPPTGAYQGYGAPQGAFALHTAVAELADMLGIPLMQLIRKNCVQQGSRLEILRILGEGREGIAACVESCGLHEALAQGEAWLDALPAVPFFPQEHWRFGKGFSILQQGSGLPGLDQANARVALCSDGSLLVQQGGADIGTGLDTVLAKITAETLCIPLESVQVLSGDTDSSPFDTGAYASSGTFFSGNATLRAAQALRAQILHRAALILNEPESTLTLEYPATVRGKRTLSFAELAHHAEQGNGSGPLVGTGSFVTEHHAIPYGAHFCQVAVNTHTGQLKVCAYHALHDSGTPINPELAAGQVYGGVLKSIGHSLWEEMILDKNGHCLNPSLEYYGAPAMLDLPEEFRVRFIETTDPHGPYGAKSISEIAVNGAAPALAAAIHDAIGVWIYSWPFSPEKILKGLGVI